LLTTDGHPTGTKQWCEYQRQHRASDIFPWEVLPHLALIFLDVIC
jgi:hypothetical protein